MTSPAFFLLFCLVLGAFSQQIIPEQCFNYQTFTNHPHRTTAYVTDFTDSVFCDTGVTPGWYKILPIEGAEKAADIVWTSPGGPYRCGAEYPIFIKANSDPYPVQKYANVTVDLCLMTPFSPVCLPISSAQITNCGVFNVYKLSTIPFPCSPGYCFSNTLPCETGSYSETGYEPCANDVPTYSGQPVVESLVENNQLVFRCNAESMALESGLEFNRRVRWYFERAEDISGVEHLVHEEVNPHDQHSYRLREQDWVHRFYLGVQIRCSVAGLNSDFNPGRTIYSERFFAGLKAIVPDAGMVVEANGNPNTVTITSTVPILCPVPQPGQNCAKNLKLRILTRDTKQTFCELGEVGETSNLLLDETECGAQIEATPSHSTTLTGTTFVVRGRMTTAYEGDGQTTLSIGVDESELDGRLSHWFQKLPDIPIKVVKDDIKVAGKQCRAYTDPNFKTFAGSYYQMHIPGTYIMYKHETQPVQVQARFEPCNPTSVGTCICAVAVQSGKDIFVYDHCTKNVSAHQIQYLRVGVLGCDNKAMHISKNDDGSHKIVLPTGTIVTVSGIKHGESASLSQLNDLSIYPSALDWGQHAVGGLCGVLTDSPNDFKIRATNTMTSNVAHFAASWKVNNRLEDLIQKPAVVSANTQYNLPTQCTCQQDEGLCEPGQATRCKVKEAASLLKICRETGRSTRQILLDNDLDIFADPFDFMEYPEPTSRPIYTDVDSGNASDSSSIHQSNIVQQDPTITIDGVQVPALNHCEDFLKGNLPQECIDILGSETDRIVDSCISDIQLTGTDDYMLASLQILFSSCENVVTKNNSFWVRVDGADSNGNPVFAPPTTILQKLCPGACSLRGECVSGECKCNDGFSGVDCGYVTDLVPSNLLLLYSGLCDLNQRSCEATIVYGNNFQEEEGALKCRLREFVLNNPLDLSVRTFTRTFTVPAEVMSINQAKCDLEPSIARKKRQAELGHEDHLAFGFEISMSNDGEHFSDEERMIVYDSRCFMINRLNRAVQLKDNACVINGRCFVSGDRNSDNDSQICQPPTSQTNWSTA